jgi:formate dehydrogenase major subunit
MENIKVIINGKEVLTSPDKTILEAVHESKIDKIPTLCHDKRIEPFTSCFLCTVEVEGVNKLVPSCSTKVRDGMKIITNSSRVINSRKTALELLFSNHYADCVGPCKNNCPAGVDAQAYIALSSMGKYREALKLVKENNPLPLSLGRVCVRDCENACRRNLVDEPVACNYLKRFIADQDNFDKWIPECKPAKEKKVAIIGGGPAGLTCAYYLALEGYHSTIFEKLPHLGGMLRYGIPEYRLPKNILDDEIEWILNLGVDVKTGVEFGKDTAVKDLLAKGYDSIFIGVGAHQAATMGLEGEDKIESIFRGIDFLRSVEMGTAPRLSGTVAVIGGGNTAIDAARTALRCGAEKVKIIYRRSIKEMPANREEIEAAEAEGVEILFLTNPKSIIAENNRLKGFECLKMKLEAAKPGERPQPVPIPGSEYIIDCDFAIGAIGQKVDTSFVSLDKDVNIDKRGTVKVNAKTLETTIPGVFAGGDVVTGPLTAISSIAQGKLAARAIISYFEKGSAGLAEKPYLSFRHRFGELTEREFSHIKKIKREKNCELAPADRIHSFDEVETGITEEQLQIECSRCLECGCSEFYDCTLRKYAEEYNININDYIGDVKKYLADYRHPFIVMDPNKCINCGKCVRTCSEILKVSALGFVYRGFKSVVKPAMEKALIDTNCIACGNCIDACPTGAISEKFPFKILGTLPKENHETVCSFCSVGCRVNFKKISDDIFYVSNSTEEIMDTGNRGYLCVKGRFGHRYLMEKGRALNPVIRKNGLMNYAGLDEAINYAGTKLKDIIGKYGPDSVALFASPNLSNEELYLLQKFARAGLKTNNIASFSNLFQQKELNGLDESLGLTVSTTTMESLQKADIIVVINSNLSEENLVMELKIKEAQKKGAELIVIDSSEIKLTRYADLWIDSKKGTNTLLLNILMKMYIENNSVDKYFIKERTDRFREFYNSIYGLDIEEAAETIKIDIGKVQTLFEMTKDINSNIIFIYNIDSHRDKAANDLKALGNLLLMTGRINRENNGIILLKDNCNSTGILDMGVTPEYLPGYIKAEDKEGVGRISELWKTDLTGIAGKNGLEERLRKREIKAALVFGEDIYANENFRKYFSNLEFLLVSDSFNTDTLMEADVALPASTHIEQEGTFTSCDHTVQKANKIVSNSAVTANWEIITRLARQFAPGFSFNSQSDIWNEIKLANRYYKNMEFNHSVTGQMFSNGFAGKKLNFALYQTGLSAFEGTKIPILFQENYYIKNVKLQLI